MRRGNYGFDAPYALAALALLTLAAGAGAVIFRSRGLIGVARPLIVDFAFFFAFTSSFLYTTRRGKFIEWERILDGLHLRGDENVLDVGCGRGAVSTAVARRLTSGRVTGVGIWSTADQSGNAREVTLRNAALEGVGDRMQVETADMRVLPFPDASFDLVVSSLAIHNISPKEDRRRAVAEAYRVLKPGGHIAVADIRTTALYAEVLEGLGAKNVRRRLLGWRFWWGNPLAVTRLVTAEKA